MWLKQSFSNNKTNILKWDRKFHMNVGKKSLHIDEPAYFTGPAHLVWTVPYILRNFHN